MTRTLDDAEMIEILEDIARNGNNGAARIAAIKTLKEFDGEGQDAGDFDALDNEIAKRRKAKGVA